MPITKSAIKALRQASKRRARNFKRKETYKAVAREIKYLTDAGNAMEATALLPRLYKTLDKAAKTHAIKKNKASRLKSRISKKLSEAGAQKNKDR